MTSELIDKLRKVLSLAHMEQREKVIKVDFEEHADATEFFDTLVEIGEPDVDAIVEEVTST